MASSPSPQPLLPPAAAAGDPAPRPPVAERTDAAAARSALAALGADRVGWFDICAGCPGGIAGAWVGAGAVAWSSAHPWERQQRLHVAGSLAAVAALLVGLVADGTLARGDSRAWVGARVGDLPGADTAAGSWYLRTLRQAPPQQPGEDRVDWLPVDTAVDREVQALLAVGNPQAAVPPGHPAAGRWCGVRDSAGALVAVAAETRWAGASAHLSSLAVHPQQRRQGWGAAVTAWFARTALATGAPVVLLGVEADNHPGRALYDRLGFTAEHRYGVPLGAALAAADTVHAGGG